VINEAACVHRRTQHLMILLRIVIFFVPQFVAGYQDSRFGYFVKNYACLYTSKATNLGLASTSRAFRTSGELLPHDNLMTDVFSEFVSD
jgi:hypothetical protein